MSHDPSERSLLGRARGSGSDAARVPPPRSRQAELAAAFDSDGDSDGDDEPLRAAATSRRPRNDDADDSHVFFDAGDALPAESDDPLGASRLQHGTADAAPPPSSRSTPAPHALGVQAPSPDLQPGAYDFEAPSFFSAPGTPGAGPSRGGAGASGSTSGSGSAGPAGYSSASVAGPSSSFSAVPQPSGALARTRLALGRFGRFVGMRVPGATYASLSQDDGQPARRRVMGGGSGDGVFANLSAKPERRRRTGDGEDRGDDDDLVDEVLPPTYDVAAADAAPAYWETTIIGGGLHPLAPGGMGWTPGGAHVGAIEDLIIDGLPVGNFFGFAWNLLVSMSFQFVGFLLTYLLHTTHAARCGSQAGLGITLIQYGFFLRTRSTLDVGKPVEDAPSATPTGDASTLGHQWWELQHGDVSSAARSIVSRGLSMIGRQIANGTADALAAGADSPGHEATHDDGLFPVETGAEWLAYILMVLGWFMLLSSLLSYWRVHRWGYQLVAAHRRDNADTEGAAATAGGAAAETDETPAQTPVGFIHTLRAAMSQHAQRGGAATRSDGGRATGTGEDWLIFPGSLAAGLRGSGAPARDDSEEPAASPGHMSPEERRLMAHLRGVGLH